MIIKTERPGQPSLEERKNIKSKIINIIKEKQVIHPEGIRKAHAEKYNEGKKVSWLTIRRYLDILKEEGVVEEEVITQGTKRKISFISLVK